MYTLRCKHGNELTWCALCNGTYTEKQKTVRPSADDELLALRERHELLKARYKSYRDIWTEDEIYLVYERLKDTPRNKLIKEFYRVSYELERTKNAVAWMYSHIFSSKKDLHRGRAVNEFRAMLEKQKQEIVS